MESRDKPRSFLAAKTKEMLDSSLEELDGLDEVSIKAIHFFLSSIAGIQKYELDVLYKTEPKQIVIHAFDLRGREYFVKPKDRGVLESLAAKIGISNYLIRFAKREEGSNGH